MFSTRIRAAVVAAGALLTVGGVAVAQERWKSPPPEIVRILDAPPAPMVSVDPTKQRLLLSHLTGLPPLADLARPMLRLAGSRIDPGTNGRHGPRRIVGLSLMQIDDGKEKRVELPPDVDVGMPSWAQDGRRFAFTLTHGDGIEVWVGDAREGTARAVTPRRVNGTGRPFQWMPGGRALLCELVPEKRGAMPERPAVPAGPAIQESSADAGPVRTYQDLLRDAHDEALFDHFFTSELVLVDLEAGATRTIGAPALFDDVEPAPSGELLLVTRRVKPWSWLFPAGSFPAITEVWTLDGRLVREIERHPLLDNVPIEGVKTGPRAIGWRPDRPATLTWAEALDGGDPKRKVERRDRWMELDPAAPGGEPREILRTEHRFTGAQWLDRGDVALVREFDRDRRWMRAWIVDVSKAAPAPRLLWDRSVQDRYGDPGVFLTTLNAAGRSVILTHDGALLLAGNGATRTGDRPFLARLGLADFASRRLWECEGECLESVATWLAPDGSRILTRHESPRDPPNWHVRELAGPSAGTRRAVTRFPDPAPQLRSIEKRLVTYARKDGVALSATLHLPPGFVEGQRRPLVVWAYPQEFNDAATAGQVSGSPWQFTMLRGTSHLFLLLCGYVVMDGATMPVVGDPETANDTFVEQIVASAQAAIDHADALGAGDRARVGVGGHSYGAFMTANLLAHCDLFRAGVARSGAYNRSLTPFGFQNERRTFWEAPDVYMRLSPFTHATKINEPLLLIHGELDNNQGTFPIQSERLYQAVKGAGGTARLVLLPHEAHGYQARESTLHVLAEMIEWFDRHLKVVAPAASAGN